MLNKIKYGLKRKFFRCMEEYDITMEELKKKQLEGAEIVDVRSLREFREGHIEGSINIPEYEINNNVTKKLKDKNKEIVLYCTSGFRSTNAYKKLKNLGYQKVYNLYGGLDNYLY